ncbi:hypothetical protein GEMRC1_004572 [Eukaryota sp. GEM-RC1]
MQNPSVTVISDDNYVIKALLHFYSTKPQFPNLNIVCSSPASSPFHASKFVSKIVPLTDTVSIHSLLSSSHSIITDIRQDHTFALPLLNHLISPSCTSEPKTLLFLSSILTWIRTVTDDEDQAISEDHHQKRRTHIAYRELFNFERFASKSTKGLHHVSFLYSGLLYGLGETGLLGTMFENAWKDVTLSTLGDGQNRLAMIHVLDLIAVIDRLLFSSPMPDNAAHILAVDNTHTTQLELVEHLSQKIGTGEVEIDGKKCELTVVATCDELLSTDCFVESTVTSDLIGEDELHCGSGLIESWDKVLDEYRKFRNLKKLNILVDGPPGSDCDAVATEIGKLLDVPVFTSHLLSIPEIQVNQEEAQDDDEEAEAQETESPLTKLGDMILKDLVVKKKGFIIAGLINSTEEYSQLFKNVNNSEDDEEEANLPPLDYVLRLGASKDYLRANYGKNLKSDETDSFEDSCEKYFNHRSINDSEVENDIYEYFSDTFDSSIIDLNIESAGTTLLAQSFLKYIGIILDDSLLVDASKQEIIEEPSKVDTDFVEQELTSESRINEQLRNLDDATAAMLEEKSKPFQEYLEEFVIPELSDAIQKVVEVKPDDPIEMLATLLLKKVENY